jgi:hypothetical protein
MDLPSLRFVLAVVLLATGLTFPARAQAAQERTANLAAVSRVAQKTYLDVRSSGEVFSWEVAGPRDRTPHYCADECACIAKKFTAAFKAAGLHSRTVLLRPSNGSGWIDIKGISKGIFKQPSYSYHYITLIPANGTWLVLDPVITGTTNLEPLAAWKKRVQSPVTYSFQN